MDQHVVTDWKEYFASLPEGRPCDRPPISPMFEGTPHPSVVFVKNSLGDLEFVRVENGESLFDRAKELFEANDGPQMWVFSHLGGPPWKVAPRPKAKKKR